MTYTFHSLLPPEEIPALMERKVAQRWVVEGRSFTCNVRWSGYHVTVTARGTESYDFEGGWKDAHVTSTSVTHRKSRGIGAGRETTFFSTFRGKVTPDGKGGSILRGRFYFPLLMYPFAVLPLIAIAVILLGDFIHGWERVAAVVFCIFVMIRNVGTPDEGGAPILARLENAFLPTEQVDA